MTIDFNARTYRPDNGNYPRIFTKERTAGGRHGISVHAGRMARLYGVTFEEAFEDMLMNM